MLLRSVVLALSASLATAIPSLEVRGNSFVNPRTGNRFQVVGVDYQPGGSAGYKPQTCSDPLGRKDICLRDAALLQILGVNAIRVYNLDPNTNHDECASIFNAAGIYMIIDVNSPLPGEALTSFEPWTSYYDTYLNRTFAIVESFKNYPNTLMFFSANEVINSVETASVVPRYLRALTRDLKNYIKRHSERYIPVGYSAADVREVLFDTWNYLVCDNDEEGDEESHVDVFALNSYSWCGDSNFVDSTFSNLVDGFKESAVPIYFSEFGCNSVTPRPFTEIGTIYSDKMDKVFSGGLVYEYTQEPNNYGLVEVQENESVKLLVDFNTLAEQYKKLDFQELQNVKYDGKKFERPKCSAELITKKGFDSNFTIPTMPNDDSPKILEEGVKSRIQGKIVKIDNWASPYKIFGTDGSEIKNLAVKPIEDDEVNTDEVNTPDVNEAKPPEGVANDEINSTSNNMSEEKKSKDSGAMGSKPSLLVLAVPLVLALFSTK